MKKNDMFCAECGTSVLQQERQMATSQYDNFDTSSVEQQQSYSAPPPQATNEAPYFDQQPVKKESPIKELKVPIKLIAIAAACVMLLGVGIYLILRPNNVTPTTPYLPPEEIKEIDEPDFPFEIDESPSATMPDVQSLDITHNGASITDISMDVGEAATLHALIEPFDAEFDISWENSDPQIFSVVTNGGDGAEVTLTGLTAGTAKLTVKAGNITRTCIVRILGEHTDQPPPPSAGAVPESGTQLRMLYDEIENTRSGALLVITWISGDFTGSETSFERDRNSRVWMMVGRDGDNREVFPEFGYDGESFTIAWQTTTRVYYLSENGTGYFQSPNGSNSEPFSWEFWTY